MPVRDEKTVVARLQENFLPLVRRTLRCLRSPLTVDLGIAIIDGADCDLAGFIPGELDQHNRYLTRITGELPVSLSGPIEQSDNTTKVLSIVDE
jgi:hypothetical protein